MPSRHERSHFDHSPHAPHSPLHGWKIGLAKNRFEDILLFVNQKENKENAFS